MSATFQCCTCGEAVGSYHMATCVRRGQVLPSEAPGCIEAAVAVILAHIAGEPARLAAAREEQREACALDAEERVGCASTYDEIRSVPLDARPLADRIEELEAAEEKAEEGVRYWTDLAQAEARDAAALRARVAELEAQVQVMTGIREDRNEAIEALRGLVSLAEHAMAAANRDGAEYHPDEELREARAVLAKHPEGK